MNPSIEEDAVTRVLGLVDGGLNGCEETAAGCRIVARCPGTDGVSCGRTGSSNCGGVAGGSERKRAEENKEQERVEGGGRWTHVCVSVVLNRCRGECGCWVVVLCDCVGAVG